MAVVSREFLAEDAAVGARELIEYCYARGLDRRTAGRTADS